jgi:hypothetical protein
LKDCPNPAWHELGIDHLLIKIEDNPYEDILICLDGVCVHGWIMRLIQKAMEMEKKINRRTCTSMGHCPVPRNPKY